MRISDWSSDVCSSDLPPRLHDQGHEGPARVLHPGDGPPAGGPPPDARRRGRRARVRAARRVHVPGLLPGPRRGAGRSEEHTSELTSLMRISYAVFYLKNKIYNRPLTNNYNYTHT